MMLDAAGWDALLLSLLVGVTSIVIALPLAIWVAWVLARRNFWGKAALNCACSPTVGSTTSCDRIFVAHKFWSYRPP